MTNLVSRFIRKRRFGDPVIVVSGLPRSGTSMLMKMLAVGGVEILTDNVREADEDNPTGYYEFERVKQLDKSSSKDWVKEGRGKAIKVISQLLDQLPRDCCYRVIFMNRHLNEVVASQNKMLVRRGETVDAEDDEKMKQLFLNHLNRIRLWLSEQPNFEVVQVDYRHCISDPVSECRRIASFIDRDLCVERMASVVDPDLYRNRD